MLWRDSLILGALLLSACDREESQFSADGLLSISRDGYPLMSTAATASRCPADSTIAIVALGPAWVVALSLRVAWPVDSARNLTVAPAAGVVGTAIVAARPVADSIGPALLAMRGTVHVAAGALLSGRIWAVAPTQPGAPDSVRLEGQFDRIAVADDLCPPLQSP